MTELMVTFAHRAAICHDCECIWRGNEMDWEEMKAGAQEHIRATGHEVEFVRVDRVTAGVPAQAHRA